MSGRETERNLGERRETEETESSGLNKLLHRDLDGGDVSEEFESVHGGSLERARDPDQGFVLDLRKALDQMFHVLGPVPERTAVRDDRNHTRAIQEAESILAQTMNGVAKTRETIDNVDTTTRQSLHV